MKLIMYLFLSMVFTTAVIAADYRKWTDSKGHTLSAKFLGFSDDGVYVICESQDSGKRLALIPRLLSPNDRRYIDIRKSTGEVFSKTNDGWISMKEKEEIAKRREAIKKKRQADAREKHFVERAETIINKKSPNKMGRVHGVKILQMLGEDMGLCILGNFTPNYRSLDSRFGIYSYDDDAEVILFLKIPETKFGRKEKIEFNVKSLYWAGTYSYTNQLEKKRTVNVYTPDKNLAIDLVRRDNNLYDDGDKRFTKEDDGDKRFTKEDDDIKGSRRPPSDQKPNNPVLSTFGSGFIVTKNGYLVTNYHVIKRARIVKVFLGENAFIADIIKSDAATDLAVLKISGDFTPIKMAAKSIERMGKDVFTMGFPKPQYQGFAPKVTRGIISSLEGYRGDIRRYQIDAAIQSGNSGGPLADNKGNLVGVVVSSMVGDDVQNVNYAVKKSYLLAFLESVPECVSGIEVAKEDNSDIPLEDAVEKVRKSCVQLFVYE